MNLSELQIKPELRDKWAAVDLGVLMARRWYGRLLISWSLPAILTYALCTLFFYETPWLSLLIVWWLKPLYDRMPLLLLSRFLFNEKSQPGFNLNLLWQTYGFDLFSALTWRRVDLHRSFTLAITVLERQKGVARSKRAQLLKLQHGSAASWLTITLVHLEMLVCFGLIAAAALFIPVSTDWAFVESLWENPLLLEHIYNLVYLVAVCLIAPFYVACGFSLYINRRIELEAWDLELVFRHCMSLREKAKAPAHANSRLVCAWSSLLLVFCLSLLPTTDSLAAESISVAADNSQDASKEEILSILEEPPFVIEKNVQRWEWKNLPDNDDSDTDIPDWLLNLEDLFGIADIMKDLSVLFEILVWTLIAILIFLLAKSLLNNLDLTPKRKLYSRQRTSNPDKPELIMGMAVTAESLPENIEQAIRDALDQGQSRLGLSLLYRYCLNQLIDRHQLPLQSSHTEQECAHIAAAELSPDITTPFLRLTSLWQQQAYAHRTADSQDIMALYNALSEALQA